MEHEAQFRADVVIRTLFVGQLNAQADGLSAGLGGAEVGCLHDSRPTPRADDEPARIVAERHGPGGNAPSQLARFLVIAGHLERRLGIAQGDAMLGRALALPSLSQLPQAHQGLFAGEDARRAEHHDCVAHFLAPQTLQRIDVFGEDPHGPRRQALHKHGIAIWRFNLHASLLTSGPAAPEASTAKRMRDILFYPESRRGTRQNFVRFYILRTGCVDTPASRAYFVRCVHRGTPRVRPTRGSDFDSKGVDWRHDLETIMYNWPCRVRRVDPVFQ